MSIDDSAAHPGSISFNTANGSISGSHYSGPAYWFSGGGGSVCWIKLHKNSGTGVPASGPANDVVTSLASNVAWTFNNPCLYNGTVSIYSDAGGTNLLASATLTVTLSLT